MNLVRFLFYLITIIIKLSRRGGVKAIAAENLLLKQQLITLNRNQKRSPKLKVSDRFIYGILSSWINPKRLLKSAIIVKPNTLLRFHKALVERKYHILFSNKSKKKPGPKGPSNDVIKLIIEMKKRNPRFGYLRIAMEISNRFGIELNKNIFEPTVL